MLRPLYWGEMWTIAFVPWRHIMMMLGELRRTDRDFPAKLSDD